MTGFALNEPRLLADLTDDEFRQITKELRHTSDQFAYAAFGASHSDTVALCLCGWQERFATLAMFRGLGVPLLVAQDPFAPWFTGSPLCAGLHEVEAVARARFPLATRWLLGGQSSGGFAALALSRRLVPSLTVAVSPQCFDDSAIKASLRLPPDFISSATPALRDLRTDFQAVQLEQGRVDPAWIITAHAESGNPPQGYLWIDAMHWSRLADVDGVRVMMLRLDHHHVLHHNSRGFAKCMRQLAMLADWSDAAVEPVLQQLHDLPGRSAMAPGPARIGSDAVAALLALIPAAPVMEKAGLRQVIDAVLNGFEGEPSLLHTAGVVQRAGGHDAEARALFERALAIAPDFHFSSTELASLLFEAGEFDAARGFMAMSLKQVPSDRRTVMVAVHHALHQGEVSVARSILTAAGGHDGSSPWIEAELAGLPAEPQGPS